jgi:hypothetical protein
VASLAQEQARRFGLVVVVIVTIASIVGPTVIKRVFGFTPDYIPSHDRD